MGLKTSGLTKNKIIFIDIILVIFCVFTDRLSKYYAVENLKNHPSLSVFKGVLEFHYLENSGAAFGLLKNQRAFLVFVGIIILLAIFYAVYKYYGKRKALPQNICLMLIAGGAIGNFIDRVIYGYVIDFIYFSSINFPVFNIADFYVSIGTLFLIIFILFYYKENDLLYMEVKERKLREINNNK